MSYRQVLGRVVRRTGEPDDQARLFMPAEPRYQVSFSKQYRQQLRACFLNAVPIALKCVSNISQVE